MAPPVAPFEQTIELEAFLDMPGSSHEIAQAQAYRVPYGLPTRFVLTLPQLQGAGADAGATGELWVSQSGTAVGSRATLTQSAPGVFAGEIAIATQQAAGAAVAQWSAFITTGGAQYLAVQPSTITFTKTGRPLNMPPVVALTAPANGANLSPGNATIGFTATDDAALIADNFAALVDGSVVTAAITLSSGSGTMSVVGGTVVALDTVGSHTLQIRATDELGAVTTSSARTVSVAQPTRTLDAPTSGATADVGQAVSLAATCAPALATGTEVRWYNGATQIAAGAMSSGAATGSYTTAEAGTLSITAQTTTPAGTVTSSAASVTVADYLPAISAVSPADAAVLAAGAVSVSATITHAKSRPMLARFRVDSGDWVAMTAAGSTYSGTSAAISVDGSHTLTIQATDAADFGTPGAITTSTTSFSVTYAVAWNAGVQGFSAAFASTTSPGAADVLDLSGAAAGAVNGAILKVAVPAGATSFGLILPSDYSQSTDATIAWVDASTLDGWTGYVPGAAYTVLLKINTSTKEIAISDRVDVAGLLPATARLYRMASSGVIETTGRDASGASTADTATAAGSTVETDPVAATRYSSFGDVARSSTSTNYQIPVAGSTTGATMAAWVKTSYATATALFGAPCGADLVPDARMGAAVVSNTNTTLWMLSNATANELTIDHSAGAEDLRDTWVHVAITADTGTEYLYLNGEQRFSRPVTTAATWVAGVATGQGFHLGNPGGWWPSDQVALKHAIVAPVAMSADQIGAHLRATAAIATTAPHVFAIGSSIQDNAAGEVNTDLSERTRVAAGVPTTHWHHYAVSGSPVITGAYCMQAQRRKAMAGHISRGQIVIIDWGSVGNEAGGGGDEYRLAQLRLAAGYYTDQVKTLLLDGARIISIDWAASFDAASGGNEVGALERQTQDEWYAVWSGSVLRLDTRRALGPTWANQAAWYIDNVHFNDAALALLSAELAVLVSEARAQPIPAASPLWI